MYRQLTKHYLRQPQVVLPVIDSGDTLYSNTPDRQSVLTLNMSDIHKQATTSPKHTYRPDSSEKALHILSQILNKLSKSLCTYMLYHTHTSYVKNLTGFEYQWLCQYSKTHQEYLFENSNKVVNCSYIPVFLKQSTCYIITPDTHQWYKINPMKYLKTIKWHFVMIH